jgi:hypothetical protein
MQLVNETELNVGWALGFQKDGRELLIIAAKATFDIPEEGEESCLSKEQAPLIESDKFTGEPGFSATLYESDYAHHKPFCDVLVNGFAHAPNAKPSEKVTVGLRIGLINKRFSVLGDRMWEKVFLLTIPSPPEPFTKLPISYDRAYGGTDKSQNNPGKVRTYIANPIGVGYYPLNRSNARVGKPLSNTHELGHRADAATGNFRPMSFSAIGRNFKWRLQFAGTYDQKWLDDRAPFFPDDFDYRYFQCAPPDQLMPYPSGGEEVSLENLTPNGFKQFRLPELQMPVLFIPHRGEAKQHKPVIDTIVIEPDKNRFVLTWRTSFPLRKTCFELREIIVGKTLRTHRRETRQIMKTHYRNLEELIQASKRSKSEVSPR